MFERFTQEARAAVIEARNSAGEAGSACIEPLHLLAGLYLAPGTAHALLAGFDISPADLAAEFDRVQRRGGINDSDAEALAEYGIDVEHIVERVERVHGKGALARGKETLASGPRREQYRRISFGPEAKKVLERSLREAVTAGNKHLGQEHLLLALAAEPGPAADVLANRGIGYLAILQALHERRAG